jgi:hypothetical protein
MVDSEIRGHRSKIPSMLQVHGDRALEENVYLKGGQSEPVLQARWLRASSQGMYRREPEMPALPDAQGTVGAQNGGTGLRSSEEGKEKTHPRIRDHKR